MPEPKALGNACISHYTKLRNQEHDTKSTGGLKKLKPISKTQNQIRQMNPKNLMDEIEKGREREREREGR